MIEARCSCGAVALSLPGPPAQVVACHCTACQRRTGAPFGVGAFYPAAAVTMRGPARQFVRTGASGAAVRHHFCPECGSTVWWTADRLPGMIGVALGAIADPAFPAPNRSIFEQSRHPWVAIAGDGVDRRAQGSA